MKENIKQFVQAIQDSWYINIDKAKFLSELKPLINAYNTYQENERDGVDYIFDLFDQEDLATCVEGGLTANSISSMVFNFENSALHSQYFKFGCNYIEAIQLSEDDICSILKTWSYEVIANMITHPHTYDCNFYIKLIGSKVMSTFE